MAAAAEKIYAQTNSFVGSIGVIYLNLIVEETLKEKLGITPVVIKSTRSPFKDRGSIFRQPTEEEMQEIRADIDAVHERFVKVVSEGRDIPLEDAWSLANGEIFDGQESIQRNLVDAVGFLDDAIDDLAAELSLEEPMVVRYIAPPSLREILTARGSKMSNPLDLQGQLEQWITSPRIVALWPGR